MADLLWKRFTDLHIVRTLRRVQRKLVIPVCGNAKVGATAGWVVTGSTNKLHATLPASQTNATLVIPIEGLYIGDRIRRVELNGQVESAGGNVTCTMSVRKQTNAAADNSDAEICTDDVGTLTADTLVGSGLCAATCDEPVIEGVAYYVLLTATTAGSTDIDATHLTVTIDQN